MTRANGIGKERGRDFGGRKKAGVLVGRRGDDGGGFAGGRGCGANDRGHTGRCSGARTIGRHGDGRGSGISFMSPSLTVVESRADGTFLTPGHELWRQIRWKNVLLGIQNTPSSRAARTHQKPVNRQHGLSTTFPHDHRLSYHYPS